MINKIKEICFEAIIEKKSILHKQIDINLINISRTKNDMFGHFQLNNVNFISRELNIDVITLFTILNNFFNKSIYCDKIFLKFIHPYFINFILNLDFIEFELKKLIYIKKIHFYEKKSKKIILDYSGPNIAKDMHVGHLRSTIIGEFFANLFKILGHKIIKINHIGDWGTQFGMLIYYIKNKYSYKDFKVLKISLSNLSDYYKKSQIDFKNNLNFKESAKNEVVKLQNGDKVSLGIWKKITNISKKEYMKIYTLLNVNIEYKGESFYNKLLKPIVIYLEKKKLVTLSDNAKCIYINTLDNKLTLPVIIQKSDGAFNYSTSELASLYYRIKYHNPDIIIYITDIGQKNHFDMIFKIIRTANIKNNNTFLIHVPLGLMLNLEGKKIKTREGTSEKLIDLIYKSINFSRKLILIKNKKFTKKKIRISAIKLGINNIKYADLSHKLDQNYIFDYKNLLKEKGNTASFLTYAYVRIISIKKRSKINIKQIMLCNDIKLNNKIEIDLSLHLLQYSYIIKKSADELNPNILTFYLYKLAEKFHFFFHTCNVTQSEYIYSRLALCEIVKNIFESGFKILGLDIINYM